MNQTSFASTLRFLISQATQQPFLKFAIQSSKKFPNSKEKQLQICSCRVEKSTVQSSKSPAFLLKKNTHNKSAASCLKWQRETKRNCSIKPKEIQFQTSNPGIIRDTPCLQTAQNKCFKPWWHSTKSRTAISQANTQKWTPVSIGFHQAKLPHQLHDA